MELTSHVDRLRHELAVAAGAAGDEARALADRLTAPLDSAARLVLLEALSAAADEITRELAPGSVEVRLHGSDPAFVVVAPPSGPEAADAAGAPAPAPEADDGPTSRINVRLPDSLKARVEDAAARDRLSVNAWLVRAASAALEPAAPRVGPDPLFSGRRVTGWVR